MFNMSKQSDIGYKLVIIYNKEQDKYYLTGYHAYDYEPNRIGYAQDGATLVFNTMQEAIEHIINYPNK
jgi:hypothetical protein